jgi:phenylacetic acid degradation operon negative regulatory protein
LIISIYGLYARTDDSWLSVAAIVRLMSDLGADEHAVRAAVYRLKQRGVLVGRKIESIAGYELSSSALQSFAEGDARIFGRRRASLHDGWILVVFSVPEAERGRRHELRVQLQRLDFGSAAPGVWVAPGNIRDETEMMLRRHGLSQYADIFQGEYLTLDGVESKVQSWWNFGELSARHAAFTATFRPLLARWTRSGGPDSLAFRTYIQMLTMWRRIPDPLLPEEVLPNDWAGLSSEAVFSRLTDLLRDPAARHAGAMIDRWGINSLPRRAVAT